VLPDVTDLSLGIKDHGRGHDQSVIDRNQTSRPAGTGRGSPRRGQTARGGRRGFAGRGSGEQTGRGQPGGLVLFSGMENISPGAAVGRDADRGSR